MSNESYCLPESETLSRRYYRVLSEAHDAVACFVRRASLFFAKSPRTLLRVLCIMAYDMVHVMDRSHPLSRDKVRLLANVLDLAACVNSAVDGKRFDSSAYKYNRVCIERAGVGKLIDDFVVRLGEIEVRSRRMVQGSQACENARVYREAVVRLNMGVLAAVAFDLRSLDEGINCTHHQNISLLLKIVMLMQVIDDILDYRDDLAKGLPSFLTMVELPDSLQQVTFAVDAYSNYEESRSTEGCYPFRLALGCVGKITWLAVKAANWMYPQQSKGMFVR